MMNTGVILLDASGRVRYTTSQARAMIMTNGKVAVKNGLLLLHDNASQLKLHGLVNNAIRIALREPFDHSAGILSVAGQAGAHITLSVMPLSSLANYSELRSDNIAAAIFISANDTQIALPVEALKQLYNFTPRELQVCQAFVNEADLERVAQSINLQVNSVRSLLKSVYSKTGQKSQAELMRLLMASRLNFRHV